MSETSGTGLPASIEAAWGIGQRPAKGPKPGLSLDRIVAAAVSVAATEGLAAVSMNRVGAELGTSAMTLYRYLGSKDELLALMADTAIGPPPPAPPGTEGWRANLEHWAKSLMGSYRQHPWVVRISVGGPPVAPNQVAWMERALASLDGTGLRAEEKLSVLLLLSSMVRSDATLSADLYAAWEAAGAGPEEAMHSYGRALAKLTDAEQFPALTKILESGVLDHADHPDTEFHFSLDRVLDGIEALIRTRTAP
jgi:AcrR family transcriptional regulator